jgi:hypothetical protein
MCCVCGLNTIFFIWTSCRRFPKEKLISKYHFNDEEKIQIHKNLEPKCVCFRCYNKMDEHNE